VQGSNITFPPQLPSILAFAYERAREKGLDAEEAGKFAIKVQERSKPQIKNLEVELAKVRRYLTVIVNSQLKESE
jgi:hypothetical protein